MTTAISFETPIAPPLPAHRFTVEEYHQLGELGLLCADDQVELLEGWIVKKMNQRPAHGFVVGLLNQWLQGALPAGWIGRCQLPITTDRSEPEPDFAVVQGAHRDFASRHPRGEECRLVIEVADTSLDKDRAKAAIYASSGVAEYWIINLEDDQVERFVVPQDSNYCQQSIIPATETATTTIGDTPLSLAVAELRKK